MLGLMMMGGGLRLEEDEHGPGLILFIAGATLLVINIWGIKSKISRFFAGEQAAGSIEPKRPIKRIRSQSLVVPHKQDEHAIVKEFAMKCDMCGEEIQNSIKPCPKCSENALAEQVSSPQKQMDIKSERMPASDGNRACPHCGEVIFATAMKCKHCKQWIHGQGKQDEQTAMLVTEDAPGGAVDSNLLEMFLLDIGFASGETVFFFQPTASNVTDTDTSKFNLLVTNRRLLAIARNDRGRIIKEEYPFANVKLIEPVKGFFTDDLEIVVTDPNEELFTLEFNNSRPGYQWAFLEAIVEFVRKIRNGYEKPVDVITTSGKKEKDGHEEAERERLEEEREAAIERFQEEWDASREIVLHKMPAMFTAGQPVTIGPRDPDFDAWIKETLGVGERMVAQCYAGDEALVVTEAKIILLKKGAAKAAVSGTGVGVGDAVGGALASRAQGFWGMVGGLLAGAAVDYAIGSAGVIAKSIDYYNITSIDCTKGALLCHIEFTYASAKEVRTGGFVENAISENVYQFPKDMYEFILPVANEIRRRMSLTHQSQQVVVQAQAVSASIPDLIKKLAGLRDAGILTEDEFQTKKKALLDRM